ncbi:MAG: CYTH domain-containing protein [Desulfopila sp.]|jgi:CYTH domain-containing protein|nr:CYTH domain-containing protein [Desulfopila sp.]
MALEIEKKFLLKNDSWKEGSTSEIFYQGYLCSGSGQTVRVRIAGEKAFLTIKGKSVGISRLEFEYPVPLADAQEMLEKLCRKPIIHKCRFFSEYEGFTWEIDEFYGDNQGLVLAEIELKSEEQAFPRPPWLGEEVSGDRRYYNAALCSYPYKEWKNKAK